MCFTVDTSIISHLMLYMNFFMKSEIYCTVLVSVLSNTNYYL